MTMKPFFRLFSPNGMHHSPKRWVATGPAVDSLLHFLAFNTGQRDFALAPDLDDLIASTTDWPANDLFPSLGLPSL
jgi:hypothetical protein